MRRNSSLKHLDFVLLDLLCVILSFLLAYYFRHNNFYLFSIDYYRLMCLLIISINIIVNFFFQPFKNVLRRGLLVELKTTILFDSICFLMVILYIFIFKISSEYSRIVIVLTYFIYFISSYFVRIIWKKYLLDKSKNSLINGKKSLLIVCDEKKAKRIIDDISKNNYEFYQINGLCIVDKKNTKENFINKYKIVAHKDDLLNYISKNWVDEILISCDINKLGKDIIEGLKTSNIEIHLIIEKLDAFSDKKQTFNKCFDYNVISITNVEYDDYQLLIKRCIDIIGSIIGCIITLFLFLIIGSIIYIKSPGPVIYVSNRVGKNGKIFKFYKFRSMILNADDLKNELRSKNRNKDGMMFKIENDPRIIPGIGNFIRKTSLDEFPQFFNVLKGDMSLVGTRPPTLDEWNKYSPYHRSRLSIKPGITGLWQTSGRSNILDFNEVVKLDNEYIKNWSLSLDIKILFKTVIQVFYKKEGAM